MASAGGTPDIVFRGTDGNECEEFIAAIEELAFTEGWPEDKKRMLLFARSRLRQKALRWFARLDPSKKNDWDLFVEALFDQYPLVEPHPEAGIATPIWSATTFSPGASTAALPSDQVLGSQPDVDDARQATTNKPRQSTLPSYLAYDSSALGRQIGILRIVVEDGTTRPQYVWRGRTPFPTMWDGRTVPRAEKYDHLRTTMDPQDALVVCFISSPEPHLIGCLNNASDFFNLAIGYFFGRAYAFGLRATNTVAKINEDASNISANSVDVSKVWNVLPDGSLQASISVIDSNSYNSDTRKYTLEYFKTTEVHLDTTGASVCFVKPGTLLRQDDPSCDTQLSHYEFKTRIVFEPL